MTVPVTPTALVTLLEQHFASQLQEIVCALSEVTMTLDKSDLLTVASTLRDAENLKFSMLVDVTAVDYSQYGLAEWQTEESSGSGYCRGVTKTMPVEKTSNTMPSRFAVIYHLLSLQYNQRLRIKVFLDDNDLQLASVIAIWPVANWFEREVFDLFGILFSGHPDLRRILTDYGFIGHPFRKDFPLSGHVEMRYDAASERVIYEAVDIEPRVLVPKVIRSENDYGRASKRVVKEDAAKSLHVESDGASHD